ncbi:MAG: agmatine deiminase family protein [Verrucomicrobia bacterium]|nr:agmatine deiminase family protein [Verrucomicrobiota bacterium]
MRVTTLERTAPLPADLGFSMPAEWEPHTATWLGWPHHPTDWPGKLDTIRWVYGEIVRKLAPGERVRLLVPSRTAEAQARHHLRCAGADVSKVQFIVHRTNRGWMRDCGPLFVRRRKAGTAGRRGGRASSGVEEGETAVVDFHFNAWAKYDDWRRDGTVPGMAAELLGKRLFDARWEGRPFVVEGGGIEVNGRGTLLTTEECYLDPKVQVRNPGLGRRGIEGALRAHVGVGNVQWLAAGPAGDDTHGHIDDICRFVNPRTVVLIRETNARDENYRPLAENWERMRDVRLEDGSRPEVMALPMPSPLYHDGARLPASYANFYIGNAAVLVPTFNDPRDRVALGALAELFPDREVVGIHAVDLVLGFGTLHCLTQQEPLERRRRAGKPRPG